MREETFGDATMLHGDALAVLPGLGGFHACVTDPPYGLEFMGRAWDGADGFRRSLNAADADRNNVFGRTSRRSPEYKTGANWQTGAGFSKPGIGERKTAWPSFTGGNDLFGGANPTCASCGGRARGKRKCGCDTPDWRVKGEAPDRMYGRHRQMQTYQGWATECFQAVYDALLPGAYLLCFGGTRTWHRLACAVEDAGFEIRDTICWVYGSGFPKSLDVRKAIDKAARGVPQGAVDPTSPNHGRYKSGRGSGAGPGQFMAERGVRHAPPSGEWAGWGTALKPAFEPIIVARKPLGERNVAANVMRFGTGALNIDASRVPTDGRPARVATPNPRANGAVYAGRRVAGSGFDGGSRSDGTTALGRWPANVIHDGSDDVLAAFPNREGMAPCVLQRGSTTGAGLGFKRGSGPQAVLAGYGDTGSAARFFYCAKASKRERDGSSHPTIKPLALMRHLVRLVTPPGGTVLDPFAGSGTTGAAALAEGFRPTLIEREAEYLGDIRRRLRAAGRGTKAAA